MLKKILLISGFISATNMSAAYGTEYTLVIQPILPPQSIEETYKPLADYLSEQTGKVIKISSFRNFKAYWSSMKREKGFDFVLDAAHITDYRIKKMGYKVLAKLPDTVSLSIVTGENLMLLDEEELLPYRIATMISPGIGGLRLRQMFPDPANRPTMISASDSEDAISKIRSGMVDAAIVPTLYLRNHPDLNVVVTTDPIPHMGLSAAPGVPAQLSDKIRTALIGASKTIEGQEMLAAMKLTSFVPANADTYNGYSEILEYMRK